MADGHINLKDLRRQGRKIVGSAAGTVYVGKEMIRLEYRDSEIEITITDKADDHAEGTVADRMARDPRQRGPQ